MRKLWGICPEGASTAPQWFSYKPGRALIFTFRQPFSYGRKPYHWSRQTRLPSGEWVPTEPVIGWFHCRIELNWKRKTYVTCSRWIEEDPALYDKFGDPKYGGGGAPE